MRLSTFVLAGALALGFAGTASAQGKQDFQLANATGYPIAQVHVSASNDDDWGDDIMGRDILENGEAVDISFARKTSACKWDLQVVYQDDDSKATWRGIDLCKVSKVTLKYNRKTETSTAVLE